MGLRTGRPPSEDEKKWEGIIYRGLRSVETTGRDKIYASNAGLCVRQTAGLMLLEPIDVVTSASSQFYFKLGSALEDVVKKAFINQGVFVDAEPRIESFHPKINISGRIDFIIKDPIYYDYTLVELKSCGRLPTSPRKYQLAQLKTYMVLTGAPKGLLWYVSRNVANYKGDIYQTVFEVTMTDEERRHVLRNIIGGQLFGDAKVIPPLPSHMRKSHCGFCPLHTFCWDDEPVDPIWREGVISVGETTAEFAKTFMDELDLIVAEFMDKQTELWSEFTDMYRRLEEPPIELEEIVE